MDDSQNFYNNSYSDFSLKKTKRKKIFWLIVLLLGSFLICILFFALFSFYNSKNISKSFLETGKKAEISENKTIKFKFGEEKHLIKVESIGLNSVDILFHSEPIKVKLFINNSNFLDLNGDGEKDIRIKLEEIKVRKAVISIKRVDGNFCIEDWKCSDWGMCIDNVKKRKCIDLNDCGKDKNLPKTQIYCINEDLLNSSNISFGDGQKTCIENNAVKCNESQKCNGFFINSSDSLRCCSGKCISFLVNESISEMNCDKRIKNFIEAAESCSNFSFECHEKVIFPVLGLIKELDHYYEILGYSNGSCILYYEYKNFSINYSYERYYELLEAGKSPKQIEFEVISLIDRYSSIYEGKNLTCYYPKNDLIYFLNRWEDGKEQWSLDVLGRYNCTGDLKSKMLF